ncbi:MAG: hypothetical protein WDW38_010884 [Sanguina aurantia]
MPAARRVSIRAAHISAAASNGATSAHSLDILVVGAGIAGLATALALHKVGLKVRVLESASSPRAEGAALGLWSNAWRALEVLGVADTLREDHLELKRVEIVRGSGETLTTFPFSACKVGATGQEVRAVKRAALQEALAAALPPGCITYNARVVGVSEAAPGQGSAVSSGAGVSVRLQDGREERCGLLIGADGSRSAVVDHLQLPGNTYSGYIAYRGIAKVDPSTIGLPSDTVRQIWGNGVRAGMIPLDSSSVYWFATQNLPASMGAPGANPGLDMRPASVRANVLQCIRGWAWGLEQALDSTPDADLSCRGITDRWTLGAVGSGCVTLVGDALHPMTPNLGQGGCVALEDSVVLARTVAQTCSSRAWTSMGSAGQTAALSASLRSYEQERSRRCLPITVRSNLMGLALQIDNPLVCTVVTSKPSSQPLDILVVGAGIAGLATALALHKVGLRVRVLESASSPRAEGAALGLWSNAWRALEVLGVADTLREDHLELKRVEIVSDAGETLTTFPFSACKVGATGQEVRAVKRAALQEALAAALPPGCITYNARVVGVSEAAPGQGSAVSSGAGVRVRLQDGREERCGLLIGADGSRSAVVDHLQLPANSYAGYNVPASMGAPGSKPGLDMRPASVRARVQQCITGWAWGVEQALDSTLDADLSCRGITDRWTFGKVGGGCVTLAGDALHPTTPNLGQGGCMALEDSVVLARTIAQTCRGDAWTSMGGEARAAALSASLRSYEQERATRCLPVTVRSNLIGFAFQMDNPLVCQARNTFVKKLFSPVHFLDHTSYDCGKLPVLGTGATTSN